MRKAIIQLDENSQTGGNVSNIIEMLNESVIGFQLPLGYLLWDCGEYPVAIGDRWDDGVWTRDGLPLASDSSLSPLNDRVFLLESQLNQMEQAITEGVNSVE